MGNNGIESNLVSRQIPESSGNISINMSGQIYQTVMALRKARLDEVDALERVLEISPRTAELRKWYRKGRLDNGPVGE